MTKAKKQLSAAAKLRPAMVKLACIVREEHADLADAYIKYRNASDAADAIGADTIYPAATEARFEQLCEVATKAMVIFFKTRTKSLAGARLKLMVAEAEDDLEMICDVHPWIEAARDLDLILGSK